MVLASGKSDRLRAKLAYAGNSIRGPDLGLKINFKRTRAWHIVEASWPFFTVGVPWPDIAGLYEAYFMLNSKVPKSWHIYRIS
jgi:hypothetical protein